MYNLTTLQKVHLLTCPNGYVTDCTAPGGRITDFNIWDRPFALEEMKKWTTCQ
jgi:hypothetical protein